MKKRHEALIALSHHHHHALVIALKLVRAGEEGSKWTVEEIRQETLAFWKNGGAAHFREEEEVLLPTYANVAPVNTPEIKDMLIDHVVIRSWMQQLEELKDDSLPLMRALGERLQTHVRLEERHIFPKIEEALTEAELHGMKEAFHLNYQPKPKEGDSFNKDNMK